MYDIPTPTHLYTHLLSYADDLTLLTQHPKHETAATQLQEYIYILEQWFESNRLKVSLSKSTLTLITPWAQEYSHQPIVTLNNSPIPHNPTPTLLGVTYDRRVTFRQHIKRVNAKARTRLSVLRALTTTSYGHSKEDITRVYRQFIRPILTYAHAAWHSDIADSLSSKNYRLQKTRRFESQQAVQTPHLHIISNMKPKYSQSDNTCV